MGFEWDDVQEAINRQKHGITFNDAASVFGDPLHLEEGSARPEHGEERRKAIGMVQGRIVTVIFTIGQDQHRIISPRRARPDERQRYNDQSTTIA